MRSSTAPRQCTHLVVRIVVARSGKTVLCSIVVISMLACTFGRDSGIAAEHVTEPPQAAANIEIIYLGKSYNEPEHLSLMDRVLTDQGVEGARLGISDNNRTGSFLGQKYELAEDIVPADGDVVAKAKQILARGPVVIVADLKAPDLLAVADLPEAKTSMLLNIRSSNESLRQEDCQANVFHIVPGWAMRADALEG